MAAETQPAVETTSTTAEPGTSDPATNSVPGSDVGGTEIDRGDTSPGRRSNQLGETGDGTRRLIILGGVALLIGAVVVAFTGRDEPLVVAVPTPDPGSARHRRRLRRGIPGWDSSLPLAPGKRELARRRAGFSASSYPDDEPGA